MYELHVGFDPDTEDPSEYGIARIVSFNSRHGNFERPERYLVRECPECNGYGKTRPMTRTDDADCPKCEGTGEVECKLDEHPDVLAIMSYYEHGLCRWMVGPSVVPDYGGFDTTNVAGVMVWNGEDDERKWWNDRTDEERSKALDAIADEYTSWVNGDCYYYSLTELDECPTCHATTDGRMIDGCGGYIGSDYFVESLRELFRYEGIDPKDVKVTGEAKGYFSLGGN